jgi:hypothetical protein
LEACVKGFGKLIIQDLNRIEESVQLFPSKCPDVSINKADSLGSQGQGDAKRKEHVSSLPPHIQGETCFRQLVVNGRKSRAIVVLDEAIFQAVTTDEAAQFPDIFFLSLIHPEYDTGKVRGAPKFLQDVGKNRSMFGIREFRCQKGNNEYSLFPFGTMTEFCLQPGMGFGKKVKRRNLRVLLGEI